MCKYLIQLNTKKKQTIFKKWAEDINRHVFKEDIIDGQQAHERCSTSLNAREMRIKTINTMKDHLTPVRMAIIKTSAKINASECVEKRKPSYTVGGNVNQCGPSREQMWRFLIKTKNRVICDPAISLLGMYLEKTKTLI